MTLCQSRLLAAGTIAPAFSLRRVPDGDRLTSGELRGRPAVLFFWAVWCPACKSMFPRLAAAARRSPDVRFVAVHADPGATPAHLAAFARQYPDLTHVAGGEAIAEAYRVATFPTTYVVDAQGRICDGFRGTAAEEDIARAAARCSAPRP
jgi:thiol-disulfide isomerase/thioredoxin